MTMKSCNEKLKLAAARHTQKNRKTDKTNYNLSRQTLLTTLNPDVLDTLYNSWVLTTIIIRGNLEK